MIIPTLQADNKKHRSRKIWRRFPDLLVALIIIIGTVSALLCTSLRLPALPLPPQHDSQSQQNSGLATIAAPLKNVLIPAGEQQEFPCTSKTGIQYTQCIQQALMLCGNASNCGGIPQACQNVPPVQFQECLEGITDRDTYTAENPKIQNPIAKGSPLFYFSPFDITIANTQVNLLWGALLGIVDAFIVVIILLQGLRIILVGSVFRYAQAIEELPGVLLALIVAHISLTFMVSALTLGNSTTKYIYTFVQENPSLQRTTSGFGSGKDVKEYTIHVFFPETSPAKKQYYETTPTPGPTSAVTLWPVLDKNQINTELQLFSSDNVCTWKKTTFDDTARLNVFGDGKAENSFLYLYVKTRSQYILNHRSPASQGSSTPQMSPGEISYLQNMPQQIKNDIERVAQNNFMWYKDWKQFVSDMDRYEEQYVPPQLAWSTTADAANIIFVFGYAEQLVKDSDSITYTCSSDAIGSTFQLVPDDLNFTDFFKNLQDLTHALSMMRKVLALMLLAQMMIRIFFINLYIVTAPLGISCWALPGGTGRPVTRLWLQGFFSTVFVQFVMVIAIIAIQLLIGNFYSFIGGGNPQHIAGNLDKNTFLNLLYIACLWFVIRIPALFNTAPMQTMVATGNMMAQTVGSTIAAQVAQFQMVTQAVTGALSAAVGSIAR